MAKIEEQIKVTFDTNADSAKKAIDRVSVSVDKVDKKSGELDRTNKKVSESQAKVSKSSNEQTGSLDGLSGGFGSAIQGAKGFLKQLSLLLANPIVALLAALAGALLLVFKAFTSTKEGGEALDRVMAGVGATIDVLRDRLLKLIQLDFKGAFLGVGKEIAKEFNAAADAVGRLQAAADQTRELSVARSALNVQLAESKRIIEDENASYKDKQKAIDEVRIAEGKQTEQELANAKKKLDAQLKLNSLSDSGKEDLQAAADAEIAYNDLLLKSSQDRTALLRNERRAKNEEETKQKQIQAERNARVKEYNDRLKVAAKEREAIRQKELEQIEAFNKTIADKEESLLRQLQDLQDDSAQEKLDRQKLRDEAEIELLRKKGADVAEMLELNAQIYAEKQADLDERAREEKEAKEEREREEQERKDEAEKQRQAQVLADKKIADAAILAAEKEKKEAQRSLEDKALGVAGILAGKNRTLQKSLVVGEGAVALGRLFSKSAQGDGAALALGITQAGPVAGPALAAPAITSNKINTALSAATIIASTKKALQALGGGGSISAGSTPTISAPAAVSAAPQVGFQSSSENQIATSIASNQSKLPPIKAFVVTSEITEGQNQDAKLIAQNSFG